MNNTQLTNYSLKAKDLICDIIIICVLDQNNQSSKSATIEMYAPSSYNDTVTGETLSSVSEKSETYSNEGSSNEYVVSIYHNYFDSISTANICQNI